MSYKLTVNAEQFAQGLRGAMLFTDKDSAQEVLQCVALRLAKPTNLDTRGLDIIALNGHELYSKSLRVAQDNALVPDGDYEWLFLDQISTAQLNQMLPKRFNPVEEITFEITEAPEGAPYAVQATLSDRGITINFSAKQWDFPRLEAIYAKLDMARGETIPIDDLAPIGVKSLLLIVKAFDKKAALDIIVSKDGQCYQLEDDENGIKIIFMGHIKVKQTYEEDEATDV